MLGAHAVPLRSCRRSLAASVVLGHLALHDAEVADVLGASGGALVGSRVSGLLWISRYLLRDRVSAGATVAPLSERVGLDARGERFGVSHCSIDTDDGVHGRSLYAVAVIAWWRRMSS